MLIDGELLELDPMLHHLTDGQAVVHWQDVPVGAKVPRKRSAAAAMERAVVRRH